MKNFKVGDQVRLPKNAQGTAWEQGKIMHINGDKALIGYGSRHLADDLRIYGPSDWIKLSKLERI